MKTSFVPELQRITQAYEPSLREEVTLSSVAGSFTGKRLPLAVAALLAAGYASSSLDFRITTPDSTVLIEGLSNGEVEGDPIVIRIVAELRATLLGMYQAFMEYAPLLYRDDNGVEHRLEARPILEQRIAYIEAIEASIVARQQELAEIESALANARQTQ